MQAPLGLAVIGGLVMSTFATLLVLPSIFAVVIGKKVLRSPSIYPDDRESVHYDPNVFAEEVDEGEPTNPTAMKSSGVTPLTSARLPRSILHEIRSKRHDMVTHHTVGRPPRTLGFGEDRRSTRTAIKPRSRSQGLGLRPGTSSRSFPHSHGDS